MTTSLHKLIFTASTATALLISTAALAKAPTGRPGQSGGSGDNSHAPKTGTSQQQSLTLGESKEQHIKDEKNQSEFREKLHEQALKKEQLLKDKNSGTGIVITHGGGNLPKEPGNNPNKDCNHDGGHDYCGKNYCRDHYRCCYMECSYESVGPMNTYVVRPGDTFASISLKFFGNPSDATTIAEFNRLPINAVLTPGQTLVLPPFSTAL